VQFALIKLSDKFSFIVDSWYLYYEATNTFWWSIIRLNSLVQYNYIRVKLRLAVILIFTSFPEPSNASQGNWLIICH